MKILCHFLFNERFSSLQYAVLLCYQSFMNTFFLEMNTYPKAAWSQILYVYKFATSNEVFTHYLYFCLNKKFKLTKPDIHEYIIYSTWCIGDN